MAKDPTLRAVAYLFLFFFALLLGGFLSPPLSELVHLLFVLLVLGIEFFVFRTGKAPLFFTRKKDLRALWLFPAFALATLLLTLLSARLTVAAGGTVPAVVPSTVVFLGGVLLTPVTEELLFRGVVFSLLLPCGRGRAILLSAILFALTHGSFFQFPYALAAGAFLSVAMLWGGSLLFPLAFHLFYNLLSFFSAQIPTAWLIGALGVLTLFSLPVLIEAVRTREKGKETKTQALSPAATFSLLLYTFFTLAIAFLRVG